MQTGQDGDFLDDFAHIVACGFDFDNLDGNDFTGAFVDTGIAVRLGSFPRR